MELQCPVCEANLEVELVEGQEVGQEVECDDCGANLVVAKDGDLFKLVEADEEEDEEEEDEEEEEEEEEEEDEDDGIRTY